MESLRAALQARGQRAELQPAAIRMPEGGQRVESE
jgi:hypothetical protein